MKLSHPEIKTLLEFGNGNFPTLVIENPDFFYKLTDEFYRQSCGGEGDFVLSLNDRIIPITVNLELLTNFFPFEISNKSLLNKLTAELENQALSPKFYEITQQLLGSVEKWLYDLAFQAETDLEFSRLSVSALLKAAGICIKEEYTSLAEKLLIHMDLMANYKLAQVFVFINLRSFLGDEIMEIFTDCCCRKGYNILLIDNHIRKNLSREKRTVIDIDLCEI